ncbi:copper-containing nitrite reductase [Pleomorphomonas koreensis]|uniref:copper-containing nitrite reductase n=1 Tax=Pleomorphomonas koreensis TaxID=257440 RepID=UPI00047B9F72|nr:copper-containing nitrite reductase [Pleomorphomonas koreensis]
MLTRRSALFGAAAAAAIVSAVPAMAQDESDNPMGGTVADPKALAKLSRVKAQLVPPPNVMKHGQVARGGPKIVEFQMMVYEKEIVIDDEGTSFQALTFEGSMPGPTLVVHEGDYVELTLINPESNTLPHNIDFHGATGALGGAQLTLINPGEQASIRFKATRAGVFLYHCAPPGMISWHVTSGMSGTLMVLPRDGLKDANGKRISYDQVYTIGEFDLYVPRDEKGAYRTYESPGDAFADTIEVMKKLIPTHVVFNGKVGALTGDNAMKAKVGETVLFIHSSGIMDCRPHLIGGHADWAWEHGKFNNPPQRDFETWFIRGGSAGAMIYTFLEPGIYNYVDHNLIKAEQLGAIAHVKVDGEWNHDLMTQIVAPAPIKQ